jgi:glycosyltransferase involved in cell wall biosynthesis
MQTNELNISVIIPVSNGGDEFRVCLSRLAEADPAPYEIIVVANGDTDGSSQLAEQYGVLVLREPHPIGPAKARNIGAEKAQGDIIFFVDADVTIQPDAIDQIGHIFNQTNSPEAVIGSYDDEPAMPNFISQYKNLMHHFVHQSGKQEASTFWGACGAIKRDAFLAVGGFDEKYIQPSIEDIELGYRLIAAGNKIHLAKNLQIKHLKHWGVISLIRTDFFNRALPWAYLILQQNEFVNDLNIDISSRISVALSYLFIACILFGWVWPWLLLPGGIFLLVIIGLNSPLYRFFYKKRGLGFMVLAIFWHYLYFLYSGLAFIIAISRHYLLKVFSLFSRRSLANK